MDIIISCQILIYGVKVRPVGSHPPGICCGAFEKSRTGLTGYCRQVSIQWLIYPTMIMRCKGVTIGIKCPCRSIPIQQPQRFRDGRFINTAMVVACYRSDQHRLNQCLRDCRKVGLVFKFPCRPGPPEIPRGFGEFRLIKAIVIVGRKGVGLILPCPCRSVPSEVTGGFGYAPLVIMGVACYRSR